MSRILKSDDGCWIWPGSKLKNGYGTVAVSRLFSDTKKAKPMLVHRITYEHFKGPIEGELDHLCRNRACCNPDHLEDVTRTVNANRGLQSTHGMKKQCKWGHPYPESAIVRKQTGHVFCGVCFTPGGKRRDGARSEQAASSHSSTEE